MTDLTHLHQHNNLFLYLQSDEIVKRSITPLHWTDLYLISAMADVEDIFQLQWLANYIRQQCNRIVILASQTEFTHLVVARSDNIAYLNADEIIHSMTDENEIDVVGDSSLAYTTLYQQSIAPEVIDRAVELTIIAIPYTDA